MYPSDSVLVASASICLMKLCPLVYKCVKSLFLCPPFHALKRPFQGQLAVLLPLQLTALSRVTTGITPGSSEQSFADNITCFSYIHLSPSCLLCIHTWADEDEGINLYLGYTKSDCRWRLLL